jgi:hypothetical protein
MAGSKLLLTVVSQNCRRIWFDFPFVEYLVIFLISKLYTCVDFLSGRVCDHIIIKGKLSSDGN